MTTENKAEGKPALRELAREIATQLVTNEWPSSAFDDVRVVEDWTNTIEAKLEAFLAQPAPQSSTHADDKCTCGHARSRHYYSAGAQEEYCDVCLLVDFAHPFAAAPLTPESPPPNSQSYPVVPYSSATQVVTLDESESLGAAGSDLLGEATLPDNLPAGKPEAAPLGVPDILTFQRDLNNGAGLWAVFLGKVPLHHFQPDGARPEQYMWRIKSELARLVDNETRRLREELEREKDLAQLRQESCIDLTNENAQLRDELETCRELSEYRLQGETRHRTRAEQAESALAQARQQAYKDLTLAAQLFLIQGMLDTEAQFQKLAEAYAGAAPASEEPSNG